MIPQLLSEAFKLRKTRSTWALLAGAPGLIAFLCTVIALPIEGDSPNESGGFTAGNVISFAGIVQVFAISLGILIAAGEFRHQTITPTLLARPARTVVVAAKIVVGAAAGACFSVVAGAVSTVGAIALVALDEVPGRVEGSEALETVLGVIASGAAFAALGVALGMLVRNQILALVGSLAYLFVVDGLLQALAGGVWKWLPFGAAAALVDPGQGEALASIPLAAAVLSAWLAAIAGAAVFFLRRRDIA